VIEYAILKLVLYCTLSIAAIHPIPVLKAEKVKIVRAIE
jgi:hypothetical protein